jgi:hypothetical protein
MLTSLPAYFLPGQLDRVTGSAYTDDPRREMAGGTISYQQPTRGFLVKGAWLIDGAVYKGNGCTYLHSRSGIVPELDVAYEVDRGSMYSTFDGNGFFGLWLTDDCAKYPLAANEGFPVTTSQPASPHQLQYEHWLEMYPLRLPSAYFRELVLFDDQNQNENKGRRFRSISNKILSHVHYSRHPGTFIIRGSSGKRRIMHNELEVAEYLRTRRGFRVVDINVHDVRTIASACAGAEVIIGVEGSHLIHGIAVLNPGDSIVTLQPPNRFCSVIKRTTDRDGQNFGFVVGHAGGDGFTVDPIEVERTLDLLPTQTHYPKTAV